MWLYQLPEQCPPSNARKESLDVYRMVKTFPTTTEDWLPITELNKINPPDKLNTPHREFDSFDDCCTHGLSVFTCLKAIRTKRKRLKKKFKDHKIVKGCINKNDGVILETYSDNHITWWLQTSTPETTFIEVKDDVTV
jgi:hypothetical protein